MVQLEFRLYKPDDYQIVKQLWIDSGLLLSISDKKDEIQILADHQGNKFYIIEKDNLIIGTLICTFDGRRGYIQHVAVNPSEQNKGIGKLIMDHAMKYYTDIRVVKVHLMVERSNKNVITFYEKLGWKIRDDLFLMTKTLRDEDFSLD
ncbi:MAG: GNAT family N-acetyltransferase [Candidatus Heimdallarchaeota archaeon]|nr:GNAT family N-acetyltransferase [Candidatus Heimdallarchaeota archaeon]